MPARLIVNDLPLSKHLLADRGYDAGWSREALENKGIKPCISPKKNRKITELSFHGINTSRLNAGSVTHVSGTNCYLSLRSLTCSPSFSDAGLLFARANIPAKSP
jgi:hypothetical protein